MSEIRAPATGLIDERSGASSRAVIGILRDIVRGGLAGLIVGLVVAGLGSRLAMRIAALLVPQATGSFTESGFRIGRITLDGSVGLVLFGGLAATLFLAVTWVVISPWLPRRPGRRALVAAVIAVAFGTSALVDARNPDFIVLRHDPLVVATLVLLIAALGPAMTLVDAWLDRRLPRPTAPTSGAALAYASLAAIGALVGGLVVLQALLDPRGRAFALTIIATGVLTIGWWVQRTRGRTQPGPARRWAAWIVLAAGTLAGLALVVPDVRGALLGLR
jgi:hypothetical protein